MPPKRTATAKAASTTATATAKANGKKRAAPADEVAAPTTANKKTTTAAGSAVKKAKEAAAPIPTSDDEEDEDAGVANEKAILASLSDVSAEESDSDNSDIEEDDNANSSDEDDEDDRAAATAATPRSSLASLKLPNSKDDAVVRARLDKLRKSKSASRTSSIPGVLYVGRLPKGFFEKQMKAYFSQFGDVTRLRVSRNKKTGASKHYAFIEFADRDVAAIVRETMDNYLIDGRLLQVKEVPKEKVHPELWVGANRKYRPVPGARRERVVRGREKTEVEQERTIERKLKRQDERREKLKNMGIEYEFEGYTKEGEEEEKAAKKSAKGATSAAKAKVAKDKAVKA